MQLPADSMLRFPSPKGGAASAYSLDPLVQLKGAAGYGPTLKKLLHLRAAFETPLLQVFGFPFLLRHQLPAAACCACCSSCCCCCFPGAVTSHDGSSHRIIASTARRAAADSCAAADAAIDPTMSSSSTTGVVAAGTGSLLYGGPLSAATVTTVAGTDTAVTRSYASMIPCSATGCFSCCKGGTNAVCAAARRRLTRTQEPPWNSTDSNSNSSSRSHIHQQTGDTDSSTRRNRKRVRLVGEDTVAAVVASAVSAYKYTRSTHAQDERAVEILISRNVLRQIKLPIDTGSYVLFFTADWLQYLKCYICAAQRDALVSSNQHHCCLTCGGEIANNKNATSVAESSITGSSGMSSSNSESSSYSTFAYVTERNTFHCSCGHTAKTAANKSSALSSSRNVAARHSPHKTPDTEDDTRTSSYVADTHEAIAPLRFTPVLRQDDVQAEDSRGECFLANDVSRSRKQVLLNLPERLGQHLKDVLLLQILNMHTQTQIDKQIVEDVLRNYLRAWHERRHDAVVFLRELLQRAEELLHELSKEQAVCSGKQPQQRYQKTVGKGETVGAEEIRHIQVPARDAVARKDEARHINEQSGAKFSKVEAGSSVEVDREATRIRHGARGNGKSIHNNHNSNNNNNSNYNNNVEDKEGSVYVQGAHGGLIQNCNGDFVFVKDERGSSSTTYIFIGEQVNIENKSNTELPKDSKVSQKFQEQRSVLNAVRSTALMKQLGNMQDLLQRGCEAAAEVFSLQENMVAGAALRMEETTFQKPKTEAESYDVNAGGTEDADTKDWKRCKERQQKGERGRKVVRIKEEKDEEVELVTENIGTKKMKDREQSCRPDGRSGVEELRQPRTSNAHSVEASLRAQIRCAAAAAQLLTESEKTFLSKTIPRAVLPSVAQAKSCSSQICSLGTSSGATASVVPPRFHASESSRKSALAATHTARGCEARTTTWQHQSRNAGGGKGGKNHDTGEEQQPYVTFDSFLQRQVEGILLLLYEAPLLCSRAGSSAVSLAVPQQGLLVRWLREGRKEVLSSLKRRRFREVLWVDVERRGLLKSGLGSRMTLLDLKGIGEVESTETAAGEVVRLAERMEI